MNISFVINHWKMFVFSYNFSRWHVNFQHDFSSWFHEEMHRKDMIVRTNWKKSKKLSCKNLLFMNWLYKARFISSDDFKKIKVSFYSEVFGSESEPVFYFNPKIRTELLPKALITQTSTLSKFFNVIVIYCFLCISYLELKKAMIWWQTRVLLFPPLDFSLFEVLSKDGNLAYINIKEFFTERKDILINWCVQIL